MTLKIAVAITILIKEISYATELLTVIMQIKISNLQFILIIICIKNNIYGIKNCEE